MPQCGQTDTAITERSGRSRLRVRAHESRSGSGVSLGPFQQLDLGAAEHDRLGARVGAAGGGAPMYAAREEADAPSLRQLVEVQAVDLDAVVEPRHVDLEAGASEPADVEVLLLHPAGAQHAQRGPALLAGRVRRRRRRCGAAARRRGPHPSATLSIRSAQTAPGRRPRPRSGGRRRRAAGAAAAQSPRCCRPRTAAKSSAAVRSTPTRGPRGGPAPRSLITR